ncbi:hypothetical protein EIN_031170 [Entamoeba invadens IP1]|uniref:N-acetyltransferase domain-containing protein n=1 Tax=Entamoeba invadens IP1 TaxID=370355 RepID=A0A0A1U401_ENTIV|nr:hypothetical protein EIN_031170 [Entamoeba invadens IP1]ELP86416.1 hypothetical protein EIN_031170 [Entamoeba invadens IP1]|eukprot:XP_004185762.1 hypothetical protein EIN_031170 [Entamoeba invadens IP1]
MITLNKNRDITRNLFNNWDETPIWSCLEGTMGHICVDKIPNPKTAIAVISCLSFLAGVPNLEILEKHKNDETRKEVILIPQNEEWAKLVEKCYSKNVIRYQRFATHKDTQFDKDKLRKIVSSLSPSFCLRRIDETIFQQCLFEKWSEDLVGNFSDYSEFKSHGVGYVILKTSHSTNLELAEREVIISGCSTFTYYNKGIEIEVDTNINYRQQGLATVCSARTILECLDLGMYPSWDADNVVSLKVAEKLGYHFSHPYTAFKYTIQ